MLLKVIALAIVVTIFGLIFFDVGFIASRFLKPNIPFLKNSIQTPDNKQALVSGTIQINGPIPQGSSISIGVREHGSSAIFSIFASGMAAIDDTSWQYIQGTSGKSYQFQAYLDRNGKHFGFATSDSITVTAPATDEVLTLNIEVPMEDSTLVPATISGAVYINGYIPQDATFDVMGRVYGSTGNFSEVVDNLPAQVKNTMTFPNAQSGTKYEIKGQLFDKNGTIIGTSGSVVLSAPSDAAMMTINSSAQPPTGSVIQLQNNIEAPASTQAPAPPGLPTGSTTISGTINFNGSAPSSSSIVILATPQGTPNQYQTVANGISPTNGATWSWNGAATGATYNMVAVLKGQTNGQNIDYADSQTYTVAAPAQNQNFTLNTGIQLGQPTGSVFTTCTTHNGNNTWYATVNFTSVTGAQYYSLQVGSTSGGTDIANVGQAAQSTINQTINVTINDSVIYYAQYAVASVTNPTPAQYSPFSSPYTIKCP